MHTLHPLSHNSSESGRNHRPDWMGVNQKQLQPIIPVTNDKQVNLNTWRKGKLGIIAVTKLYGKNKQINSRENNLFQDTFLVQVKGVCRTKVLSCVEREGY